MVERTYKPQAPRRILQYLDTVNEKGRPEDFDKQMSDARLLILNSNYNAISTVNFFNIFPTSLSTLEFDASATDINYFTAQVNFKYTIYEITDKNNKKYEPRNFE